MICSSIAVAVRALALLGFPEDLADLLDLRQQLVGHAGVVAALRARGARQLRGLVEQGVQLRVLLEVGRLEVVGPQHPQVMLDQLGALLLDDQAAGAELRVRVLLVLLVDGLDGFGLDTGLSGVIDATRQIAVRMGGNLRFEQASKQPHRSTFRSVWSHVALPVPATRGVTRDHRVRRMGLRSRIPGAVSFRQTATSTTGWRVPGSELLRDRPAAEQRGYRLAGQRAGAVRQLHD